MLNEVTAKVGAFAEDHKGFSATVSGGALAVGAGAGAYGLYSVLKGGMAGTRVLKGIGGMKGLLKGLTGTAAGIAKGKAVQAATGVTPVFVTNWPAAGLMPGGVPGGANILKSAGTKVMAVGKAALPWVARVMPLTTAIAGTAWFLRYTSRDDVRKKSAERQAEAVAADERIRKMSAKHLPTHPDSMPLARPRKIFDMPSPAPTVSPAASTAIPAIERLMGELFVSQRHGSQALTAYLQRTQSPEIKSNVTISLTVPATGTVTAQSPDRNTTIDFRRTRFQ